MKSKFLLRIVSCAEMEYICQACSTELLRLSVLDILKNIQFFPINTLLFYHTVHIVFDLTSYNQKNFCNIQVVLILITTSWHSFHFNICNSQNQVPSRLYSLYPCLSAFFLPNWSILQSIFLKNWMKNSRSKNFALPNSQYTHLDLDSATVTVS